MSVAEIRINGNKSQRVFLVQEDISPIIDRNGRVFSEILPLTHNICLLDTLEIDSIQSTFSANVPFFLEVFPRNPLMRTRSNFLQIDVFSSFANVPRE